MIHNITTLPSCNGYVNVPNLKVLHAVVIWVCSKWCFQIVVIKYIVYDVYFIFFKLQDLILIIRFSLFKYPFICIEFLKCQHCYDFELRKHDKTAMVQVCFLGFQHQFSLLEKTDNYDIMWYDVIGLWYFKVYNGFLRPDVIKITTPTDSLWWKLVMYIKKFPLALKASLKIVLIFSYQHLLSN